MTMDMTMEYQRKQTSTVQFIRNRGLLLAVNGWNQMMFLVGPDGAASPVNSNNDTYDESFMI